MNATMSAGLAPTPNKASGCLEATTSLSLGYSCEIRISKDENGGFFGYVARLPGVVGEGENLEGTRANIAMALREVLTQYDEDKQQIPWREAPPLVDDEERYWVVVNV